MNKTLTSIIVTAALASVACETSQKRHIQEVCAQGKFDYCPPGQIRWGDWNGKYCVSEQLFHPDELKRIVSESETAYKKFKEKYCD